VVRRESGIGCKVIEYYGKITGPCNRERIKEVERIFWKNEIQDSPRRNLNKRTTMQKWTNEQLEHKNRSQKCKTWKRG
jgi:hypothetical protein